jgi:hypothetical protein
VSVLSLFRTVSVTCTHADEFCSGMRWTTVCVFTRELFCFVCVLAREFICGLFVCVLLLSVVGV